MEKQTHKCLLIGLVLSFAVVDLCEALPRHRRARRRGNDNYNHSYAADTGPSAVEQGPVVGVIREHTGINRSEYDYNWAARRNWHKQDGKKWLFADKVRAKLWLRKDLAKAPEELRVKIHWQYMHRTGTMYQAWAGIHRDGDDFYYELPGLEEGRLVKLTTDVYLKTADEPPSEEAIKNASFIKNNEGTFKYVGRLHLPYYGVTSSDSNEELKRRARIVSFAFSQWYVDECYGGRYCSYDCVSFYSTSTAGELDGFTFRYVPHDNVAELAKKGQRFHGDYLTMPGHVGMALCYDQDTGNFCTIEGNYALAGPYRINIDPHFHGLYTWSSISTIVAEQPPAAPEPASPEMAAGAPADTASMN